MRRALVIGYGSIGQRHAGILAEQGFEIELVTSQAVPAVSCHGSVAEAMTKNAFDLVVISNPASAHMDALADLMTAAYAGPVLIEKPLSNHPVLEPEIAEQVRVGYNLRFLPIVKRVRELIAGRQILSMNAYVGQYLPSWRPGRDYRSTVSARRSLGGGALRELSHELDLVQYLAGPWKRVVANGGKASSLEIDVDDHFALLVDCMGCPFVQIAVNFLDRIAGRRLIINAEGLTLHADLIAGTLLMAGEVTASETFSTSGRDHSYREQIHDVLSDKSVACTWSEAMEVVELVIASEKSSERAQWVTK